MFRYLKVINNYLRERRIKKAHSSHAVKYKLEYNEIDEIINILRKSAGPNHGAQSYKL